MSKGTEIERYSDGEDIERYSNGEAVEPRRSLPARYKAVLALRRKGIGYDQIAEELGFEDRFEVVDILNQIYKKTKPINPEEVRDSIESQLDDLNTVYMGPALEGNEKAARFVLKALELKAKIRGAILPPQINVQVNNQRPWERVFAATLSDVDDKGNIIEGDVVDDNDINQSNDDYN